jgi:hypothetical protein
MTARRHVSLLAITAALSSGVTLAAPQVANTPVPPPSLVVPQVWSQTHAAVRPLPSGLSLAHMSLEAGFSNIATPQSAAYVPSAGFEAALPAYRLAFSSDRLLQIRSGSLTLDGSLGLLPYQRQGIVLLNGSPLQAKQRLFALPLLLGARYVPSFASGNSGHASVSLSGGPAFAIAPASQLGPSNDQWGLQVQAALQGLYRIPNSSFGLSATAALSWGGFKAKGPGFAIGAGLALLL